MFLPVRFSCQNHEKLLVAWDFIYVDLQGFLYNAAKYTRSTQLYNEKKTPQEV